MDIKSILLEREDQTSLNVLSTSAMLIEKRYAITTSNILNNFFQRNPELADNLGAGKLHIYEGKYNFKFRAIWKNDNGKLLVSKEANIFGFFKCKNVEEFCKHHFKDWSVDLRDNNLHSKNLVSIFIILAIEDEIVAEEELKSMLYTWLLNICSISLNKGDRIICRSCPFGTRDFLNSLSEGIISNTLNKSFLLLSDCSSTPGCEGGLIYSKKNPILPLGMIISSLNWWRKEWAGFTLIANVQPIICQIVGLDLVFNSPIQMNTLNKVLAISENSIVQINCGADWGTGILLSKEHGIFVTNSHVVREGLGIRLFWKNKIMPASLIYKNPEDSVFDLAIIRYNGNLSLMSSCNTTVSAFKSGDEVFCAGYPLLSTRSKPAGVTVTSGVISDCNPYMIKTTCGVFPGFSGGAVLNSEGILLGIIVCNTRLTDINVCYPKFNMAVPYQAIAKTMSEYIINNNDPQVLIKLRSFDSEAIKIWMRLEGKL